ncbi:MAG: cation transporter [Ruminococcaceae bacterium]|nr:cation transporter [Oscillospiraceae bacterium]
MKSDKKILIAFILNLSFSLIELIGGIFTGSIAILSDSLHDFGDSLSIGISFGLERFSKKKPDEKYTFGYLRYSLLGSVITTAILIFGSATVVYNSVLRLINPAPINYNGMIILAVFGVIVNFLAAYFTHGGDSLNQKAVNLHMLEDVLGWVVVLLGGIIMKFTNFVFIDAILSLGVAVFIFINAVRTLKNVIDIFLEKTPSNIDSAELTAHIKKLDCVKDVHHLHIWSIDGITNLATVHIVTDGDSVTVKKTIREEFAEHGILHVTIETEAINECCESTRCDISTNETHLHHHHHHHNH